MALNITIFVFSWNQHLYYPPASHPGPLQEGLVELLKPATSQSEALNYVHCSNCPWLSFSSHLPLFRHQIQSALLISDSDPALFFFNTKSCVKSVCSLLFIPCGPCPSACGHLYLACYYALTIYVLCSFLSPSQAT